jgi:transketolase
MGQVLALLDALPISKDIPTAVVCHTVKAKGLSFGEGKVEFHFWDAKPELLDRADSEIALLESEISEKLGAIEA